MLEIESKCRNLEKNNRIYKIQSNRANCDMWPRKICKTNCGNNQLRPEDCQPVLMFFFGCVFGMEFIKCFCFLSRHAHTSHINIHIHTIDQPTEIIVHFFSFASGLVIWLFVAFLSENNLQNDGVFLWHVTCTFFNMYCVFGFLVWIDVESRIMLRCEYDAKKSHLNDGFVNYCFGTGIDAKYWSRAVNVLLCMERVFCVRVFIYIYNISGWECKFFVAN